jgi:hypothetical protein
LRLVIKSSIPGTVTTDAVAINEIRYGETYADNTVINATLVNKTLKVAGGAGIQGNVNIGGRLNVYITPKTNGLCITNSVYSTTSSDTVVIGVI